MSEPQLSKDTKSLLSEASADVRQRLVQEIDELRSVIAQRIGAVETAVSGSCELLDTVALQIHKFAVEDARVADEVRQQSEAAAQSD